MSFQDVGRRDGGRSTQQAPNSFAPKREQASYGSSSEGESVEGADSYSNVSDQILQYQNNVGILRGIARKVGTKADGPVLETQYKVQVDVVQQLGTNIEKQLRSLENAIASMSRTDAARARTTHVKLNRDFRRVEETFRTINLEAKRKREIVDGKKRAVEEEEERRKEELVRMMGDGTPDAEIARKLQLLHNEDGMNEEILREREQEIRDINQGMHTVNEIYKDLAKVVDEQQSQVDEVEQNMEDANKNAEKGLKQVEKANMKASQQNQCVVS